MTDYSIVALFCEDVRREMNGQETIVGTISDSMNVTAVPGILPKLAVYIRANFNINFELSKFSWGLIDPDGNECASSVVESEVIQLAFRSANEKGLPLAGIKSVTVLSPVNLPKEGRFELITTVNEETFVSGVLSVMVAPQPEANGED